MDEPRYINPYTDFGFKNHPVDIFDRDINNAVNTARREGREEQALEIARNLKNMNIPIADIAKATGLPATEIELL